RDEHRYLASVTEQQLRRNLEHSLLKEKQQSVRDLKRLLYSEERHMDAFRQKERELQGAVSDLEELEFAKANQIAAIVGTGDAAEIESLRNALLQKVKTGTGIG